MSSRVRNRISYVLWSLGAAAAFLAVLPFVSLGGPGVTFGVLEGAALVLVALAAFPSDRWKLGRRIALALGVLTWLFLYWYLSALFLAAILFWFLVLSSAGVFLSVCAAALFRGEKGESERGAEK